LKKFADLWNTPDQRRFVMKLRDGAAQPGQEETIGTRRRPRNSLISLGSLNLLLLLLLSSAGGPLAFAAGEIQVDSAKPPTAELGTFSLDVTIKGSGSGTDSQVDFVLTGTSDPGGITVNNVRRKGPKQLNANINIAADADIAVFDIDPDGSDSQVPNSFDRTFRVLWDRKFAAWSAAVP
jgi:hypothetical protein